MSWKAKLLGALRWVRDTVVTGWNMVVDPPAAAIKWYILAVLIIAVGGSIVGTRVQGWFAADKPVAHAPAYLIPKLPSVVTTVPPVVAPEVITAETIAPAKAVPGATKKVVRKKRKPKCQTVFC